MLESIKGGSSHGKGINHRHEPWMKQGSLEVRNPRSGIDKQSLMQGSIAVLLYDGLLWRFSAIRYK
jgi:hypothetical protein